MHQQLEYLQAACRIINVYSEYERYVPQVVAADFNMLEKARLVE